MYKRVSVCLSSFDSLTASLYIILYIHVYHMHGGNCTEKDAKQKIFGHMC